MTTTAQLPSRQRALAALAVLCLTAVALVTGTVTAAPAGANTAERSFTNRINEARANRGVHRLTVRSHLVDVARAQAARMASRNQLFHNPNLTTDVHHWRWVGENVGYGPDVATLHRAFMASPGHRANLLDRDYTEVGVGVVVRNGRMWVAEVFRQPTWQVSGYRGALRKGSTGPAVKQVQRRLHVRVTGYYGSTTKAAVTRFQKRQGWRGSGVVGPGTWSRLF